jgi:tripartite-type tricarboxylate transporter receptor subunit TctC
MAPIKFLCDRPRRATLGVRDTINKDAIKSPRFPVVLMLLGWAGASFPLQSAQFPDRPFRLIVPSAPGGGTDAISRLLAVPIAESLGQPVVVENKSGGEGIIGTELVARSKPDGYTLGTINANHTIRPYFSKTIPFDSIKSFTPIAILATVPDMMLVNPSRLSVKTVKELIALALARPNSLNYSTPGSGTAPGLEMANFAHRLGIKLQEVPYKGSGPAMLALVAGEVDMSFGTVAAAIGHVNSGKLVALAMGSKVRHPLMPAIPTIAEAASLPGYEAGNWYGIVGPAGIGKPIVDRLEREFLAALTSAQLRPSLDKQGFLLIPGGAPEMSKLLNDDIAKWRDTVNSLSK